MQTMQGQKVCVDNKWILMWKKKMFSFIKGETVSIKSKDSSDRDWCFRKEIKFLLFQNKTHLPEQ